MRRGRFGGGLKGKERGWIRSINIKRVAGG